jgi:aminopeptidase YwaD
MHLMRKIITLLLVALVSNVRAQDIDYALRIIDTLASPSMEGRGYVNGGDRKAAVFISNEFEKDGLKRFGTDYYQKFALAVNTFPGKVNVRMDGKSLTPGIDYLVDASSPSLNGTFKIVKLNRKTFKSLTRFKRFSHRDYSQKVILVDKQGIDKKQLAFLDSLRKYNFLNAKALVYINDSKLMWSGSAARQQLPYVKIDITRNVYNQKAKSIAFDIESRFEKAYTTQNVLGYVQGSLQPDSFLVFTAHYDHLGRMGEKVYFPGANDNASGTAMVLDLARYYAQPEHKPRYSMVFTAVSGEETGLLGSTYLARHPLFPLKAVRFLVNLDMMGTGSEGITMVNGTVFPKAYNLMVKINADNEYILTVKNRGESCNSDHCPFYQKGVPAVFLYAMGKEDTEYHNVSDKAANLPLTEYKDIFRLVRDFMNVW